MIETPERPVTKDPGRFLLLFLMTLAVAAAVIQPIGSYDLGWHLATGRLILEEGRIPASDPFSFTREGTSWLDHEWLFQVAAFLVFRAGGWRGLLAVNLLLMLALFYLMARVVRREVPDDAGTALLLLLALGGARFRIDPRPELASLVLLPTLVSLLILSREKRLARISWFLPPLFLLWANLHPACLLGAGLVYLWLGAEAIQGKLVRGSGFPPGTRARSLITAASPLLILANPGGWELLGVPFQLRGIVASGHAPNLEWAAPSFRDFPHLYLAAVAAFALAAIGFRKLDWAAASAAGAVGVLAFLHLRNIGFFFILLPLALAGPLADLSPRVRFPKRAGVLGAAAASLAVTALFAFGDREEGKRGFLFRIEPEKAVAFIERHGIGRRLFNDVKFGGYLIWSRFPRHRVFIDGRNEIYDSLLAEIFKGLRSWEAWERLLEKYGIDAAILRRGQMQKVEYPPEKPGGAVRREWRAFSAAYFQSSRWALVFWDDQALVFVRRTGERPEKASLFEYRLVNPDDAAHLAERVARGEVPREEVIAELDHRLAEDPDCRTARSLKTLFGNSPPARPRP